MNTDNMTPEQKLEARRAYAREYYKKHAEAIKASCKRSREKRLGIAANTAPGTTIPAATGKVYGVRKPVKADTANNAITRKLEKLGESGAKKLQPAKDLLKLASEMLSAAYKSGDPKLVKKTIATFNKVGIAAEDDLDAGSTVLSFKFEYRTRIPKDMLKPTEPVQDEQPTPVPEQTEPEQAEPEQTEPDNGFFVTTDEDSPTDEELDEIEAEENEDLDDEDGYDDEDEDEEQESDDDDILGGAGRNAREWAEGRDEMFREFESMGCDDE